MAFKLEENWGYENGVLIDNRRNSDFYTPLYANLFTNTQIGQKLKEAYQAKGELKAIETDDTTIAMVSSMRPGEAARLILYAYMQVITPTKKT